MYRGLSGQKRVESATNTMGLFIEQIVGVLKLNETVYITIVEKYVFCYGFTSSSQLLFFKVGK